MTVKAFAAIVAAVVLWLGGCSGTRAERPRESLDVTGISGTDLPKPAAAEPETGSTELGIPPYYMPLEVNHLASIGDPRFSSQWTLSYSAYDRSDPNRRVGMMLHYEPGTEKLYGSGGHYRENLVGWVDFASPEPFLRLAEYMGQHAEVFFDPREFEGAEPGEIIRFPENRIGQVSLSANGPIIDGRPGLYCAVTPIVEGAPVPEEVQYVIDAIWEEFMPQFLDAERKGIWSPYGQAQ